MPSNATLERFIARVESNAHVEAIEEFYTEHATMQENHEPPRRGRDALVAHEARALSMAASVESQCVRPVFVSGDRVVIRWIFQFVGHSVYEKKQPAFLENVTHLLVGPLWILNDVVPVVK